MITRRPHRPAADRRNINAVATELVRTYGPVILEDACRFSACRADADDAYQRALEILITKSPTTDPEFLVPWIRTIARREATAIARKRRKSVVLSDDFSQQPSLEHDPEERAEMLEEATHGIEALSSLSGDQVQCLVAQAEGYSYEEIAEITGFSRRKVSRCVNEGRAKFLNRADRIATGSECERVRPVVDKFADGDQSAALAARAHLRGCAACREHLRRSRMASRRIRAIFPPGLFLVKSPPVGFFEHIADAGDAVVSRFKTLVKHPHETLATGNAKFVATVAVVGVVAIGGLVGVVRDGDSDESRVGTTAPQPTAQSYELVDLQVDEEPVKKKSARKKAKKKRAKRPARSTPQPQSQGPAVAPNPDPVSPNASSPVDDGSSEFLPEQR